MLENRFFFFVKHCIECIMYMSCPNLKDECLLRLESELQRCLPNGRFKLTVSLSLHLQTWEQISKQSQEDSHILSDDFRHVEVSQRSHQHLVNKVKLWIIVWDDEASSSCGCKMPNTCKSPDPLVYSCLFFSGPRPQPEQTWQHASPNHSGPNKQRRIDNELLSIHHSFER